jgi:aspartate/methionine/tyrosine aminotransferase
MTRRPGAPPAWRRMPMEAESPEEYGYERIKSNLAESSCRDRTFGELGVELDNLVLLYGDHRGNPELREVLSKEGGIPTDRVLLTAGAAMALFLVSVVLLGEGSHLVVVRPNYATNLETPWALGCPTTHIDLDFERGWVLDVEEVAAAIRPETVLISVTHPHNPTGVELPEETLAALVGLAEKHGIYLLVDETYREMAGTPLPWACSRSERVISVASVSKTYGIPGIREGWLMGGDEALFLRLLAAKEQMVLTGSVLDEAIALHVMKKRSVWLPEIRRHIGAQKAKVEAFFARESRVEWVRPTGGVVCFPRIRPDVAVDTEVFYRSLLDEGVFVGPGRWFDQDPRFFRLGWGWPTSEELDYGLAGISAALDRSLIYAR